MFFQDRHELSLAPKSVFLGAILATLVAAWGMMYAPTGSLPEFLQPYLLRGDHLRRGLVLFCLVLYSLRVAATTLIFLQRKLIWTEALIITFLMPFALLGFARAGGSNPSPLGFLEITGVVLFLAGSAINTLSEHQRRRFKSEPVNGGRLYTQGLFGYARHINYLGDTILFSGLALVTGRMIMLVIPLVMTLNFILVLIPRKEAYLERKYGEGFREYRKRIKRFIPYVY
jgi:protein-S-isoprenylcysteine O-methyltransferase Ste14